MSLLSVIRKNAKRKDAFGAFISYGYMFFSSAYVQVSISLLFTTSTAILINLITGGNTETWIIVLLIISLLLYLFFEFCIIIALAHKKRKMSDVIWFQKALSSHGKINAYIANLMFSMSKRIDNSIITKQKLSEKQVKDLIGFQAVAFNICIDINEILSSHFNCEKNQVTVFQQFFENGKHYSRMISYKTSNSTIPSSYGAKYEIFSGSNEKKPLHVKIFESGSHAIIALHNREKVKECFVYHPRSQEREQSICQYIGVPVLDSEGRMIFLLQVDVCDEGVLGKNEDEMTEFGNNILVPYIQLLYASYEQERTIETLYRALHINGKNGKPVVAKEA